VEIEALERDPDKAGAKIAHIDSHRESRETLNNEETVEGEDAQQKRGVEGDDQAAFAKNRQAGQGERPVHAL